MTRKYYSLLVKLDNRWSPQFGDYVRKVVADEGDDTKHHYPKGTKMKIICTGDTQASIMAEVTRMNDVIAKCERAVID